MLIVFYLLMALLILAGGAALHLGFFKAHLKETGFVKKGLGGVFSYGFSTFVWLIMYSHHYLGW